MARPGAELDWQFSEEEPPLPPASPSRRFPLGLQALISAALLMALVVLGWRLGRQEVERTERELRLEVQALLDLERQALLAGDGDLFFSTLESDPAWHAAWLQPDLQAMLRAGPRVTRVRARDDGLWANVTWQVDGRAMQRVAFFRWQGEQLLHGPSASTYWGRPMLARDRWGELSLYKVDEALIGPISKAIDDRITALCAGAPCLLDALPLKVTLAADYQPTAVIDEVRLPSPRLIGLDEDGRPSRAFYRRLDRELAAILKPAQVRFAVPAELITIYRQLATDFAEQQPWVRVEMVPLEELPTDPADWPEEIDGAALAPDAAMVAGGQVYDLTALAASDPGFDAADFYDQIWQGAHWRQRLWFVPQAAGLQLLYYDKKAYEQSDLATPTLNWTWAEMAEQLEHLAADLPQGRMEWAFVDVSLDMLYARAFYESNRAGGGAGGADPARCQVALDRPDVVAALDWYQSLLATPQLTPNLAPLTVAEREFRFVNLVTPRRVAVWVDTPVRYEMHRLRKDVGVVSFPGSDRFEAITPLRLEGSYIRQDSANPRATWQWLNYLSHQSLQRQRRLIPARPSVAENTAFWRILPRPLSEAIRSVFPCARAVTLADESIFTWPQLAALTADSLSVEEAAALEPRLDWFGGD